MKGISFSACSGLAPYFHGIARYIQLNYECSALRFAGTSGGCQAAYFLASEISLDIAWQQWFLPCFSEMKADMEKWKIKSPFVIPHPTCMKISKKYLGKINAEQALAHCRGRLFVSVTELFPYPRQKIYSDWRSFDDLFEGLAATQHLPYMTLRPFAKFRSKYCFDGGFFDLCPVPDSDIKWLKVTAEMFRNWKYGSFQGLMTLPDLMDFDKMAELRELGFTDAAYNDHVFERFGLTRKG